MITHFRNCLRSNGFLLRPWLNCVLFHGSIEPSKARFDRGKQRSLDSKGQSDINTIIAKVHLGSNQNEIFQSLSHDKECNSLQLSHDLLDELLNRFKDDWKSALAVFRWAGSRLGYRHTVQAYEKMIDILGKMRQFDLMRDFLHEMRLGQIISLNAVGKAMRRLASAGKWEDVVRIFKDLETFGLEKNTEFMNLLLDTLCKEGQVEQARSMFLELKSVISPNASSFNIFVNGWCKLDRVDEALYTIQEMKGHGYHPCGFTYSPVIQLQCRKNNYTEVYLLLEEMESHGCPPSVVTYTIIMCSLAKRRQFKEALQIIKRMKSVGCKPDVVFYNSLLHSLGRAGNLLMAIYIFEVEMPNIGVAPDTCTFNFMIALLCRHGKDQKALNLLKEMETSMLCKPDLETYFPLLKSCFRTGKIDDFLSLLLDDMVKKHHLSLDISAYTLLIHRLLRANRFEWAYCLFQEMIEKDISPEYQTCSLLLNEVKQRNMNDAAEKIEVLIEKLNMQEPCPF